MFSSERWCAAPSLTAPAAARGGDIEIIDKEILYRLTVDNGGREHIQNNSVLVWKTYMYSLIVFRLI